MNIGYLTAFEHQSVDVRSERAGDALDSGEADSLQVLGERLHGLCERGYRSVRLAKFCGIVRIGSRLLEILPKIDQARPPEECRGILLNLLSRSSETSVFRHAATAQSLRRGPLIEAFIEAFFDSVADIVRGGLMRQYQEHQADLRVVRGRIVASRQCSVLANRQDLVACHFDELTADNSWNHFIKAGLRAVKPWLSTVHARRRWTDLMIAFDEVNDVHASADAFARLPTDRKATRYLPAGEWVRRILSLETPVLRAGTEDAPGLLFDINLLWERAVATELRRRLPDNEITVETQVTGTNLATVAESVHIAVPLRPDIVIRRSGQLLAVADTKWKRLELARNGYLIPAPPDVYQMHAYATAFACEHVMLVYPWHKDLASARETVLEFPQVGRIRPRLSVVCVDVNSGEFVARMGRRALQATLGTVT